MKIKLLKKNDCEVWWNDLINLLQKFKKSKEHLKSVDKIVWGVKNIGNPVNKVIGGVTGFLDKIEEKIEEVSGVDLDSLATMPKKEEKKADEKVDEKADSDKEVKEETK